MIATTPNVLAACVALAAFAVAVLAGLCGGHETPAILLRAMLAMVVCYPVGLIIGLVCQRVIADHLRGLEQAQAAIESNDSGGAEQSAQSAEESKVDADV